MRGRWLAVTGLVLMVGSLISFLFLIKPPQATAQELPPEVTSNVTCETSPSKYIKFGLSIRNPNTAAVTYTVVRSWTDGRAGKTTNKAVPAGGTADVNHLDQDATSLATQWTYTVVVKVGGAEGTTVAGPFTSQNPCMAAPTVTYELTCRKNAANQPESVLYAPTIRNPNTFAVTYTLVRSWSDNRAPVSSTAQVAAGATASGGTLDYSSADGIAADWTHTLTLKIGDTVTGTPITKPNPCFTAPTPTNPPQVTYEVTCKKNTAGQPESVVYAPTVKNPNSVAVTYTLVRSWSDDREEVTVTKEVAAGATASGGTLDFTSNTGLAADWTHTLTVKEGDKVVGEPVTKKNPCLAAPPSSSSSSSPPPSDPSTDPSTDVAATSNNSGGGLAATGVAIAAVLGAGLLLFANGAGLMRLVRRTGEHE